MSRTSKDESGSPCESIAPVRFGACHNHLRNGIRDKLQEPFADLLGSQRELAYVGCSEAISTLPTAHLKHGAKQRSTGKGRHSLVQLHGEPPQPWFTCSSWEGSRFRVYKGFRVYRVYI